jgi:RNA polymerase sigma-70 factor (ECF subfamily)
MKSNTAAVGPHPIPETLLLQTAHASVIERAMRNLPDRFRRLLVLREFEGLSYRELANAMEIPIGTVMSRLSRARQALRDALDSEANASLAAEYSNTS